MADEAVEEASKQRRRRTKKLKKVLKERLSINGLRMLFEEQEGDEEFKSDCSEIQFEGESEEPAFTLCPLEVESDNEGQDSGSSPGIPLKTKLKRKSLKQFNEVFSVRDLLGYGAFGVVLLVKNKITNEKSALKIINKEKLSKNALNILKNESKIMCTLRHPSVVEFKQIFEN